MIRLRLFFQEISLTAAGVFSVLLILLVSTQAIDVFRHVADGQITLNLAAILLGLTITNLVPLLLILTAYISTLSVLSRYWRYSEMIAWTACGLSLSSWIKPVLKFSLPFMLIVATLVLWMIPNTVLQSKELAQSFREQKQITLLQSGVFHELAQPNLVYFIESLDHHDGMAKNIFLSSAETNHSRQLILAESGRFQYQDGKSFLALNNGYRYALVDQRIVNIIHFQQLTLTLGSKAIEVSPFSNQRTIPTAYLLNSNEQTMKAELIWRIAHIISIPILCLLAIPLSFVDTRSKQTYSILIAIILFMGYQNLQLVLCQIVAKGILPAWIGMIGAHLLMLILFSILMYWRIQPKQAFWHILLRRWE